LTVVIANYVQNFIESDFLKYNSIHRRNYWGSSVLIST